MKTQAVHLAGDESNGEPRRHGYYDETAKYHQADEPLGYEIFKQRVKWHYDTPEINCNVRKENAGGERVT